MHKASNPTIRALLLTVALAAAGAANANLLVNGSFENGAFVNQGNDTMSLNPGATAITGWAVLADTTAWIGPTNPFGLSASDGSFLLDLTNYQAGPPFAGVAQTFATVPGALYSVTFDLGSSTFWGRPDALTASAGNASLTFTAPSTGTNNDWQHESMDFTALASASTLLLQGVSGINYIGVDNVSVELISAPVPEPETWASMLAGVSAPATIARRRRGTGDGYAPARGAATRRP